MQASTATLPARTDGQISQVEILNKLFVGFQQFVGD